MNLETYFEQTKGMGVLSTADDQGHVNAAVYARPHVMEDGSLAFIMRDRLSYHNLQSNPNAAFLFREEATGYNGIRLHLNKIREEHDTPLVRDLCRRCKMKDNTDVTRHLVFFNVERKLPLVGDGELSPT
ncbi:pyridoxamine 5-phosphate oxidase-related protein, FMN-binding [Desulfosarcina variabilis str. Montpellier]|uniref:pyridoxamine 5'-phosphate oxidase family protein n=1 Tax=Desulfosarcina variabilis TaxID=2300 RepID=UPI003AFA9E93